MLKSVLKFIVNLILINNSQSFLLNSLNVPKEMKMKIKMNTPSEIINLINAGSINKPDSWSYNELTSHLNTIKSAVIVDNQNVGIFFDNADLQLHTFKYIPTTIDALIKMITQYKIDYQVYNIPISEPFQVPFIIQFIGFYFLLSLIVNFFRSGGMGPGGPGGPGPGGLNPFNSMNKPMNLVEPGQIQTTFNDVAGLDEAKEELEEIVDFLKNPFKYGFAGAKIPKGVLLEGPPGTGKTLLARVVAGEAGVAFISASGSEFIEMFVGVGAQRVRNLFKQAQENKPCVIFIDEIDAVGGKRGYGFNSGGNDEREQTLNQILTNMDGFTIDTGIIVLAATNRADTLDPALKRSGRFDRKVTVPLPDLRGRQEIAKVHFKNKPNVTLDFGNLAELTTGFSGADLATLANEAALLKVRTNNTEINNELALKAFEKMTIGLPKKYESRSKPVLELVACHEIGHTMMVQYFNTYFNLQRVTLNANTAGAGGYTLFTPKNEYAEYQTKGFYIAQIIVALGGRAAEIVYFKNKNNNTLTKNNYKEFKTYSNIDITTGASGDIRQANNIAKKYLELFENYIVPESISDSTQNTIEIRVSELISECLYKAVKIIEDNPLDFYKLNKELLMNNTLIF